MRVRAGREFALRVGLIVRHTIIMVNAISGTRKSRGRSSTGAASVHFRVLPDQAAAIDLWIADQNDPDRPEAIRRLIELGLTIKPKVRPRAASQRDRARELAGKAIDKMTDAGATADDQPKTLTD